jgi:hypothetical protein
VRRADGDRKIVSGSKRLSGSQQSGSKGLSVEPEVSTGGTLFLNGSNPSQLARSKSHDRRGMGTTMLQGGFH